MRRLHRFTGGLALALPVVAVVAALPPAKAAEDHGEGIRKWFESYDAAFNAKDISRLAAFYHPDVTIFEGGGVDRGWSDYRDNHLGPELKELEGLRFAQSAVTPRVLDADGRLAYVTAEYSIKAKVKDRSIDAGGLATYVLVKAQDGSWKIRHSHTSSRRRPAAQASPAPRW